MDFVNLLGENGTSVVSFSFNMSKAKHLLTCIKMFTLAAVLIIDNIVGGQGEKQGVL